MILGVGRDLSTYIRVYRVSERITSVIQGQDDKTGKGRGSTTQDREGKVEIENTTDTRIRGNEGKVNGQWW